jgi:hypothetical protein
MADSKLCGVLWRILLGRRRRATRSVQSIHPIMSLNPADTHDTGEPKRRKLRSCATCRRQKARCEFTSSHDTCHRCGVLNIPCIFDPEAQANRLASTLVQPTTSGAQTQIPW